MSTDTADATDDGGESTGGVRETLADAYREYVGEPDEERDIYVGFGLFFGGIALGVVGLLLFLYSGLQEPETTLFWQSREIALVAGLLGLPSVVLSIVVLLPVGRRTRLVSGVGAGLCLLAVGILIVVYPYDWTESATLDGSVITISVYSVGLVALSAATGASLVAQYLDAAAPDETTEGAADSDDGESVSDEAVAADIESAMDDAELSWGGVEQQPNTKRLSLDMPDADPDVERTAIENAEVNETRSESDDVNDAVNNLRQLQGGETETERGSSTEDQVNALTEFREQQAEDDTVETGVEEPGLLQRLRERLFG